MCTHTYINVTTYVKFSGVLQAYVLYEVYNRPFTYLKSIH